MSEHDEKDEMIINDTLINDLKAGINITKVITDDQVDDLVYLMASRMRRGADTESDRRTISLASSFYRLKKERDELAARCDRLLEMLKVAQEFVGGQKVQTKEVKDGIALKEDPRPVFRLLSDIDVVLSETPAASLAHVRAEAIEQATTAFGRNWDGREDPLPMLMNYADAIRQSASQEVSNG